MEPSAGPHRRLIWKYAAVVVLLVAAAIVSVGLTELYFTYQDSKRAVTRVERDKAAAAATAIEQRMQEFLRTLDAVAQPTGTGAAGLAERTRDFRRVLERDESITRLTYVDSAGRERRRISRLEVDRSDPGADLSGAAVFVRARAQQRYLGRVYFVGGSRPHMRISVAERAPGRGVVMAEIDLSYVRDVIERARIGTSGYAYAVDSRGVLVTHKDINLVLQHTSFASLPQVAAALRDPANSSGDAATIGRDQDGTKVLSAFQTVPSERR